MSVLGKCNCHELTQSIEGKDNIKERSVNFKSKSKHVVLHVQI